MPQHAPMLPPVLMPYNGAPRATAVHSFSHFGSPNTPPFTQNAENIPPTQDTVVQCHPQARARRGCPCSTTSAAQKKRSATSIPSSELPPKKRGHMHGTLNYSPDDMEALLDILEDYLPLGVNAWSACADMFNKWAVDSDRPIQTAKSLELKFKQVSVISIDL
jgi:hypothetical protein